MRYLRTFILAAISSASAWTQSVDSALAQFVGQQCILPKIGDAERIKVKQSELDHLKGTCDAAVLVRAAHWKSGTAHFELEHIGIPTVAGQRRTECRMSYDRMVLEITSFARDESADVVAAAAHRALETPEEFLGSRGVSFSLPAGPETQTIVRPPPPVTNPQVLLMVDGTYTDAARSARLNGEVRVSLIVGTDGRIHNAKVVHGLGLGLDENALRVFPMWRFEPARQGDNVVAVPTIIGMNFRIM